jgi:hypothetical protein
VKWSAFQADFAKCDIDGRSKDRMTGDRGIPLCFFFLKYIGAL